jgi:hypothetical protein
LGSPFHSTPRKSDEAKWSYRGCITNHSPRACLFRADEKQQQHRERRENAEPAAPLVIFFYDSSPRKFSALDWAPLNARRESPEGCRWNAAFGHLPPRACAISALSLSLTTHSVLAKFVYIQLTQRNFRLLCGVLEILSLCCRSQYG